MRKSLLFAALLIVSQFGYVQAQQSLFEAPYQVCERQPIQLISNVNTPSTHYWGFCSGYLFNTPTGDNTGDVFGFDLPTSIEIVKDGDQYYGFVVTINTNEFFRLSFGTSLDNTPVVTNYGNFDNALPQGLSSMYVVKDEDEGNWHIFLSGGSSVANSEMARIDYHKSFASVPNIVAFGNVGNVLNGPNGLFVAKEGKKWYGYLVNKSTSTLVRMDLDTNISTTPVFTDLGNPSGALQNPHDIAAVYDNGNWFFFITNESSSTLARIDMGNSLATAIPAGLNIGNTEDKLFGPNGITYIRDCDKMHLFVTDRSSNELVRIDMPGVKGPYTAQNYGNIGGLLASTSISRMIRDKDDIFAFVINSADNSITKIKFAQCTNSSIKYSTTYKPPKYYYDQAGLYNVYYAVNEGLPDMRVGCKVIKVLPIPPMTLSNDTAICQGDTIGLQAFSINALSYTWSPNFNITSTSVSQVGVWPDYPVQYRVVMNFPSGCVVDTPINVWVNRLKADAGPDRTLHDGAETMIGGPFTTQGPIYAYNWKPAQFINNSITPNPIVSPPYDFTYYLEVTDTAGCVDIDTVVVHVDCNDLNLPNAFAPNANGTSNNARFGIKNMQIIKLTVFHIFDRWGKEVFTTTDPTKEWDGTVNGENAPMGVYVWDVDGFCVSGARLRKSGNVTLIR
jgi:gliding motility-associated-like protein